MAKKVGTYKIPFDPDGNQEHYPEPHYTGTWGTDTWKRLESDFRDNFEFDDVLQYQSYSRGRSAAYFGFVRSDNTKVTVFLKDFEEMIPFMVNGYVAGRFTFIKRGQNYGCTRLGDARG